MAIVFLNRNFGKKKVTDRRHILKNFHIDNEHQNTFLYVWIRDIANNPREGDPEYRSIKEGDTSGR